MPEYLAPGVYVEEIEIGAKPIEGVSTSTAGFIGETERGPTTPELVTSWPDFQRKFGGYFGADKYLPFAVEGFFSNGGKRCYIARVVIATAGNGNENASVASKSLTMEGSSALTLTTVGEGSWGNRIAVKVSNGTTKGFKLSLVYWKKAPGEPYVPDDDRKTQPRPTVSEVFDDLSVDETSPDYYEKRVNGISNLVKIEKVGDDSGDIPDAPASAEYFTGGGDGTGNLVLGDYIRTDTDNPGERKGLTAFKVNEDISIIYSPNSQAVEDLTDAIIAHCEILKSRFAVIDSKMTNSEISGLKPRDKNDSDYAAFYYPWLKVIEPASGMKRTVPPGGHVIGIYARSDIERGVHKAPANEKVRGINDLQFQLGKGEQDILNPRGVNCIRALPGRGIRVWGARTLSSDPLWKYVNVRRLFIYLEESIRRATQWVVFEPNNERLWARMIQTVSQFLTTEWKNGALMGTTPEEAFFVKCDRTTMTQSDIDNGRLICVIGVAPVKPAEFVIFRIAQWQGGSAATE